MPKKTVHSLYTRWTAGGEKCSACGSSIHANETLRVLSNGKVEHVNVNDCSE
jgi:hypothetical protein